MTNYALVDTGGGMPENEAAPAAVMVGVPGMI